MLMVLSVQLHLLPQDEQNQVQLDFFGYVMLLTIVLASHDDNCSKNSNFTLLTSWQSK